MDTNQQKAVILLSGGLDSTTCLAIAKQQGYRCYPLSFDYGQRNHAELNAIRNIAQTLGAEEHRIFNLPLAQFGGSALTDTAIEVPDYRDTDDIPVTYVPARNTIFLSIALGWAEILGARDIFIGASAVDYSGYPDCRPDYFASFQHMADLATKAGIEGRNFQIHTPLLDLSKADTIRQGIALGVDYALTVSCYQANSDGQACGRCDSCYLRKQGFAQAKVADPTRYVATIATS